MKNFGIDILFLSVLCIACAPIQNTTQIAPRSDNSFSVLISQDEQDIDTDIPVPSDSDLLNRTEISQLGSEDFTEFYEKTFFEQGSLLKGIVDLSSITTKYFNIDDFGDLSKETSKKARPLKIVDYGPSGVLPIEMRKPTIYVQFNQPMVPISRLGEPLRRSSIMTISPRISGTYRWYGTKILSFEPDNPVHRNRTYSVRISKKAASIHGKELGTDYEYEFLSEFLEMLSLMFGSWESLHDANTEVPPEKARRILVTFNQSVDSKIIRKHIQLLSGGKVYPIIVSRPEQPEPGMEDKATVLFRKSLKEHPLFPLRPGDGFIKRTLLLEVQEDLPTESRFLVRLPRGARADSKSSPREEIQQLEFSTLSSFRFEKHRNHGYYFPRDPEGVKNPVFLNFSHPIDPESAKRSISVDVEGLNMPKHVEAFGSIIRVANLPVDYESTYELRISEELRDIYGRSLANDITLEIEVPPATSYSRFPGRDNLNSLEAQFDPTVFYEFQNIDEGTFKINGVSQDSGLEDAVRNQAYFKMVDLKPYMNPDGFGEVDLDWNFTREYKDWEGKLRKIQDKRSMTVQVTDLGLSTRYSYNRFLVWVNQLSTGEPVENARVILRGAGGLKKEADTDSSGLAKIALEPREFIQGFYNRNTRRYEIYLSASFGSDRVDLPTNPTQYGGGYYLLNAPQSAEEAIPRIFLFSDRGIYRPGETLTFRGMDWKQKLGVFTPYSGSYSISILKNEGWNEKEVTSWNGETSESGGFFGTYDISKDMEPGYYTIRYERGDVKEDEVFQIAHFRRLNFQVLLKRPDRLFFLGDTVSVPLEASYLAGGVLSEGKLSYFWTREPVRFRPSKDRWKSWEFGPKGWEGEKVLSSNEHELNPRGTFNLEVDTADSNLAGMPYRYVVEGTVQDIDRQSISAATSVIVHPAAYYIGARTGGNTKTDRWPRFVPIDREILFSFAKVGVDGTLRVEPGECEVELIKGSYTAIQQSGVGNRINTRYEWVEESLQRERVKWKNGYSEFSYTPEESGNYRLRITDRDDKEREIITDISFYASGGSWVGWTGQEDITLEVEQNLYFPGDTARILVKSPLSKGRYLMTIEREGILEERLIDLSSADPIIEISLKEEWVPVMYVTLAGFISRTAKPQSDSDFDRPRAIFGAAAINISTKSRELDIEVSSDKAVYLPGDKGEVTVRVSSNGMPVPDAEVTYLAVDRGILDIINYHIPDPVRYFYDVDNFDMYGEGDDSRRFLMAPVNYEASNLSEEDGNRSRSLSEASNLIGGNEVENKLQRRENFAPLAVFKPFLITDQNGEIRIPIEWPDTLTTYRSTAIALKGQKIGYSEDELYIKNPINVNTTLPRQMRVRDTSLAGVVLSNVGDRDYEVTVKIRSDRIGLPGTVEKSVIVAAGKSYEIPFVLEAKTAGEGEIVFTINSEVLNEELVDTMLVEAPIIKESFTSTGIVAKEESVMEEGLLIPSAIGEGYGSIKLSLDSSQAPFLREQLRTLSAHRNFNFTFDYLYAAAPGIIAPEVTTLMGENFEKDSKRNLENFLKIASHRQMPDGGINSSERFFSGHSDYYCSLVTLHMLQILKQQGRLKNKGPKLGELKGYISLESSKNASLYYQLYSHYVMSLGGDFDRNRTDELVAYEDELGISGYGLIGAIYQLEGRRRDARKIYNNMRNFVSIGTRGIDIRETYESRFYFDSGYQQLSHLLRLGIMIEENPEMIRRYTFSLDIQKGPRNWINPQDRLWMAIALNDLLQEEKPEKTNFTGRVLLENRTLMEDSFSGLSENPAETAFGLFDQIIPLIGQNELKSLQFRKEGTGTLFYAATLSYALPNEVAPARDEGLSLYTRIETLDGDLIEENTLDLGETYRMRVILSTSKTRGYVNLSVPIPSGAEIVDPSFSVSSSYFNQGGSQSESWKRETEYGDEIEVYEGGYLHPIRPNQLIYNNEIRYSWSSMYYGQREITFLFRCTTPGIYPTPPASANLLFEPEVFGRDRGRLIFVR